MSVLDVLFLLCIILLVHAYWGYSKLLQLWVTFLAKPSSVNRASVNQSADSHVESSKPMLSVLLTVHNEEPVIASRLQNILNSNVDLSHIQLLVCSDGSTDQTEAIVSDYAQRHSCIQLYASGERLGKTGTQNKALPLARGEILVFTDADTLFDENCLTQLTEPFADHRVGGTTGALIFKDNDEANISVGQQTYWSRELTVRYNESELGWLCVATGACMAIRKALYKPPSPAYGEDCVLPLDVVLAGYKMKHVPEAIAIDVLPADAHAEFKSRVRMTERNWTGTLARKPLLNPLRYPQYCFSLVSHKLLKWLTPLLLIIIGLIAVFNAAQSAPYAGVVLVLFIGAMLAAVGHMAERFNIRWLKNFPPTSLAYGFALANIGFAMGGLKALAGVRTSSY